MAIVSQEQAPTNIGGSEARMLWIDGVGGFLVVPGEEWLIGGPGSGDSVEININGDLSRRAAAIRRQGSDYILQPLSETRLGGDRLDRPSPLRDKDIFGLGGSVEMVFRKTHPLSASAMLRMATRHRTEPRCDGIVLLADTCVIGPGKGAHISCPDWSSDVILYTTRGVWQIRSDEQMSIDGQSVGQRAPLPQTCTIEGESIRMSLEPTR